MSEPSHNQKAGTTLQSKAADYGNVLAGVFELLDKASRASACIVNMSTTASYWEIGWRILEHEQAGQKCAAYGEVVAGEFSEGGVLISILRVNRQILLKKNLIFVQHNCRGEEAPKSLPCGL
jgi:hypothetical protein